MTGPGHVTEPVLRRVLCVRCKLFYKKEAEFKEKGVGTLHLKLTEQGKTQMIVRADTNLGKIGLWANSPPCWSDTGAGTTHERFSQVGGGFR